MWALWLAARWSIGWLVGDGAKAQAKEIGLLRWSEVVGARRVIEVVTRERETTGRRRLTEAQTAVDRLVAVRPTTTTKPNQTQNPSDH
jgi:hypothetical protein